MNGAKTVRFLGWFSVGLGLVELVSPGALGRYLGLENRRGLLRFYGARELGAGLGLLGGGPRVTTWLWGRVGGDALDLATLASDFPATSPQRGRRWSAVAAVAGITALDVAQAVRFSNPDKLRGLVANTM